MDKIPKYILINTQILYKVTKKSKKYHDNLPET